MDSNNIPASEQEWQEWRAEYMKQVQDLIQQYGWFAQGVLAGEDRPEYEYTVGLTQTYRHPEFIIFGLHGETMHGILSILVHEIESGTRFTEGDRVSQVIEGYDLAICSVPGERYAEYVGVALDYNNGPEFELLQVVWPDRAGRFPWEDQYDAHLFEHQPLLCATPDSRPDQ